jgi:hypothetical protein
VQSDKSDTLNSTPTSWLDRPLLALVNLDWEKALYGLFIVLAIVSRLWELGLRVMSHDETVHVQWSWYLFQGRGYAHTPLSHGPFLFHATALSYYLFGDNDFSARLVVAILGIVLVALPYTLRRWLGRSGALAASFLFLISPSLLYYSRYIRHDIPIIVWSLIALLAIFRYLDQQPTQPTNEPTNEPTNQQTNKPTNQPNATRWLVILAAAISLMFATKEVAFIYIAIFGLFLALLFFARLGAPLWRTPEWEQAGRVMLWIAAGALLIAVLTFGLSGVISTLGPTGLHQKNTPPHGRGGRPGVGPGARINGRRGDLQRRRPAAPSRHWGCRWHGARATRLRGSAGSRFALPPTTGFDHRRPDRHRRGRDGAAAVQPGPS